MLAVASLNFCAQDNCLVSLKAEPALGNEIDQPLAGWPHSISLLTQLIYIRWEKNYIIRFPIDDPALIPMNS